MMNAPTIVRLIRFPKALRLEKKGNQYLGPQRRSGPLVLSERHAAIQCTFRLTEPGFTFLTGGNTVQGVEAFSEGEQRDLLLPWAIVSDGKTRPKQIVMEIDLNYEGSVEKHTATVPIALTFSVRRRVVGALAAGAAAAAVALVASSSRGRKKIIVNDEDEDVELSLFNIAPTSRTKTTASRTNIKGAKVTVADEEDVEVAVYNVPRARKAASSKKKVSSSKKASSKKAPAKKASAKKAGGTPRGSASSRSVPRKGARGSSKARKAAPRRTTRKSR